MNKNNDDQMLDWVGVCLDEVPNASVCAHYSLRYNKGKSPEATFRRFATHLESLDRLERPGVEVLLISGSGPKKPLARVNAQPPR